MMRSLLLALMLLGACAAPGPAPVEPVDCAAPDQKVPVDGGIGGTGNTPEDCGPTK